MLPDASPPQRSAIMTLLDVLIDPRSAFASLRSSPAWVLAFVIVAALGVAGSVMAAPATVHAALGALHTSLATDPNAAAMTADQRTAVERNVATFTRFSPFIIPFAVLAAAGITGLVLLIAKAAGSGDRDFKYLFALAMNVAIVQWGLSSLVVGAITIVRGADSYSSALDIASSMPSLALVAPGAPVKLATLLASVNPFTIWSTILLAIGAQDVARIRRPVAIAAAIFVVFVGALIGAASARG